LEQEEKQSYYINLNTFGFLGMSKNPVATVLVINARLVLIDGQQSSRNPYDSPSTCMHTKTPHEILSGCFAHFNPTVLHSKPMTTDINRLYCATTVF
jgi:hypothetical protein